MKTTRQADYVIIGGGIVGLAIARELRSQHPQSSIIVLEKEIALAAHGSGRNSGVLHAGFYYSADSLKAKFCKEGNAELKTFASEKNLRLNENGKVVVAQNESEIAGIEELKKRGDANGVEVSIISAKELADIEPHAKTCEKALYSPNTATVDPTEITLAMAADVRANQVEILLGEPFLSREGRHTITTPNYIIEYGTLINAAGLYADKIAHQFHVGEDYTIIPFKGIYLKRDMPLPYLRTNIYPVPDLKNPFLGVHFTVTATGQSKIGPTAIPAFWRENYHGLEHFSAKEMKEVLRFEATLFKKNAFGFRTLALEEMKKYRKSHLLSLAGKLVNYFPADEFSQWAKPGIRAQLLHKPSLSLVQDFVVEKGDNSLHILNAVSPAFTCAIPFAQWIVAGL